MSRAARRRGPAGPPGDTDALRAAIAKARVPGLPTAAADRARTILIAYVEAAQRQGKSFADVVRDLKSGAPAVTVGRVELGQAVPDPNYACAEGCAFCCILTGADGGTITEAEARMLHAALLPRAGAPDGRAWHPRACPALDPATRMCRAYEARPTICRSYVSYDAAACEQISRGIPADGSGVISAQVSALHVHALTRAALKGVAKVSTYALAEIAAAAVEGVAIDAALTRARHRPRELDDEVKRATRGLTGAGRPG
ncbi:MAG: YkgJ family cysteine cluster protein [Pseudomonadota bacterium]